MTVLAKSLRRVTAWRPPHGCADRLVVTLHPGGILELREVGRRRASAVTLDLARLYARSLMDRAASRRAARRAQ